MFRVSLSRLVIGAFVAVAVFLAAVPWQGRKAEAAGPPAQITLTASANVIGCGYASTLIAQVFDSGGAPVADGTVVSFQTTLGGIFPLSTTTGGTAVAVLVTVSGFPGTALITASAGAVSAQVTVQVTCGNLCGFNLACANLCGLNFTCGNLCGFNFACGNLCGLNFVNCGNLCGLNFNCGNLCGLNFNCGNLCGLNFACGSLFLTSISVAPGTIAFTPFPVAATCGSLSDVTVVVKDANGVAVADGTLVTFTTTLGTITATRTTVGGSAVASLSIPPGVSGTAQITAAAAGTIGQKSIPVSCG